MITSYHRNQERQLRHRRVRSKVSGTVSRPRLSIFWSNRYLYAQLIDDVMGKTLVAINDLGAKQAGTLPSARTLGENLAVKAKAKKIKTVVFDRGGYRYTGRVKAFADAARAGGLIF
ncbi:MAG TPA: 50S ribosomal protein L18 [Candidatus Paceibacterota bacterium]